MFGRKSSAATEDFVFIFRNSVDSRLFADAGDDLASTGFVSKNVLTDSIDGMQAAVWGVADNIEDLADAFDANLNLTGTARASYLGQYGAEVA